MAGGAQKSRIAKAGGDVNLARQQFEQEIAEGRANLSGDQQAFLQRDPEGFFNKYLGQSTKGKYSGFGGGLVKAIGKAAPLAALIPGVGIPLAAGIGAAGRLASGGGLKGALTGAALGGGGAALLGGQGIHGLGGAASKLGGFGKDIAGQIGKSLTRPEGGIDLGKVLGVAGGVSGLVGQHQQRKSAENYANANIAQRNMLLNRLLQPKDYALNVPNEG